MYWYEDEVKRLENDVKKLAYAPETIFYGSSSMRLWTSLYDDFKDIKPINLGFGGSTLAACVWFFDRLMLPYNPKRLIIYAGDNDLGDGRHPEEVLIFFQELAVKVEKRFGNIPCFYISLKPSPSRLNIIDQYKYTNNLIENEIVKFDNNWQFINVFKDMLDANGKPKGEYYVKDGLHLTNAAYKLWSDVINNSIAVNQ
jgi:lysophospholipase L1-like esterase